MEPLTNGPAYYSNVLQQAAVLSGNIENYVVAWLAGHEPAEVPTNLLPYGITSEKTPKWTLVQPENINPTQQWYCVPAHLMDPEYQDCYMLGSELNITYLKLLYVAPFNSKLIVEGDFPHCRFMDFEIIQPFDPTHPTTGHKPEQPEVPRVDVDIEPKPGHVNPFVVGADRTATQRQYRVTFELRGGNAVTLNPGVMGSEYYRDPSNANTRVGGPFGFSGPYGSNVFVPGVLWIRYYAADHGTGPLAGVPIPRVIQQLSTGEQFWLQPDLALVEDRQTTTVPAGSSQPGPPYPFIGPSNGWFKIFGLVLIRYERDAYMDTYGTAATNATAVKQHIRELFSLTQKRGVSETPPGNYESSATCCNYNNFLNRPFRLDTGHVYAITGKMPTFPKTRNGETPMTGGEVRYWSLGRYGKGENDHFETAVNYDAIMDDEVVLNASNEYVLVFSYGDERPTNAVPENGITWQAWGPQAYQLMTLRWLSVAPDWHLPAHAPDWNNVPWSNGAWSAENYDPSLVGLNTPGVMGPYHPIIHYLTKDAFEALGTNLDPRTIPKWE
jgi:hypothetical protein